MAAKKKKKKTTKTATAKRRTKSVPEKQRHTDRVILRLEPAVAARLRAIAGAWHVTLAEVVTDALDALSRRAPRENKK